ncbi:MAG: DUF308 domain-containing protein [Microbacteriaceae bacterium]|nr:DUF308 domain-containing protein [Microbacteriaceae bacterium]
MTTNTPGPVNQAVRSIWWLVLIRGILLVVLGGLMLWETAIAVWAIVLTLGVYAIVDGISVIVAAIGARRTYSSWGWLIAQGVLQTIAGVLIVALPGLAAGVLALVFLWFLVFSLIAGGAMAIASAVRQRGGGRGWALAAGIVDIVFGILVAILVITSPIAAIGAAVWVLAIAAIVFGIMLIVMAFRVRRGALTVADRIDEALSAP